MNPLICLMRLTGPPYRRAVKTAFYDEFAPTLRTGSRLDAAVNKRKLSSAKTAV
jgi:hypothetical protein